MVLREGYGAEAAAPEQARVRKEKRTPRVSPDWVSGAPAPWAQKERRVVVRLWSGAAREIAWEQTYYSRETRRHGLGHSCSPLTRYLGWFFYCRYGQRCFGTAWDAETFQKHYHISSISPGSNVPRRLQCQIETRQKAR